MINFSGKNCIIWYLYINWHGRNSAYSTLRMQNCSVSTNSTRSCCTVFIFFLHSCLLLSAMAPIGSQLTCSASSLLPVPILCLSSLAWLLQTQWRGKRKAFASPFTSVSMSPCSSTEVWLYLTSGSRLFLSSQTASHLTLAWAAAALQLIFWFPPSSFPAITSSSFSIALPLTGLLQPPGCGCPMDLVLILPASVSACSALQLAHPHAVSSMPPYSSSRENHMTEQTSSVENVLSVPNSMAPKLSWIFASLLIAIYLYLFKISPVSFAKKERSSCALLLIQSESSSASQPCLIHVHVPSFLSVLQAMSVSCSPICHEVGWHLNL